MFDGLTTLFGCLKLKPALLILQITILAEPPLISYETPFSDGETWLNPWLKHHFQRMRHPDGGIGFRGNTQQGAFLRLKSDLKCGESVGKLWRRRFLSWEIWRNPTESVERGTFGREQSGTILYLKMLKELDE